MASYKKGDQERLDFGIDWSEFLTSEGVTIAGSTWTVPSGITEVSNSSSTTATSIVLEGGTIGSSYKLVNTITTSDSNIIAERSIFVLVVEDKFR